MHLITFPASTSLTYSIMASWGIFQPDNPDPRLFVLQPEEASCIDVVEPISHYHIAICQGDKRQCQDWVNRQFKLANETYFELKTDGKACCFHLASQRLIIIWMRVPSREDACCVFGLMAHESLHAAYALMDAMGMKPHFENEEFTAYLIQFLMNNYTQSIGLPCPITQ